MESLLLGDIMESLSYIMKTHGIPRSRLLQNSNVPLLYSVLSCCVFQTSMFFLKQLGLNLSGLGSFTSSALLNEGEDLKATSFLSKLVSHLHSKEKYQQEREHHYFLPLRLGDIMEFLHILFVFSFMGDLKEWVLIRVNALRIVLQV